MPPRASYTALGLLGVSLLALGHQAPRITIVPGSNPDGSASAPWLELLRRRLPPPIYDSVSRIRHARTTPERAWTDLITRRADHWPVAGAALPALFDLPTPAHVRVVVGDRGGEDGFTHDSITMGFDVAALQRNYGDASQAENADRLDRFYRHEFVHQLQKRWLARHPYRPGSAIERALLDAWAEGLGNYFSLSKAWYPGAGGIPAPQTVRVFGELEPRFVSRMAALACADSITAEPLLADLSTGPFTRKWGALPVALWLLHDMQADTGALKRFALAGPTGVWGLADRNLPGPLADSLRAVGTRAKACPSRYPMDTLHSARLRRNAHSG